MRYFLDTEYNGWGGALLSLALVPEDRGEEFYIVLDHQGSLEPWVETNVIPHLQSVSEPARATPVSREQAGKILGAWLMREHEHHSLAAYPDPAPTLEVIADWPEDIAQICMLLLKGPGAMVEVPPMTFSLVELPGFSTAANSKVPHNALHDARSLRDHVLSLE